MLDFCILLKSYYEDFDYACRLIKSINKYNTDSIITYIVVPKRDIDLFSKLSNPNVIVLEQELFSRYLVSEPVAGIRPGYINQEIIKLTFWKLGLASNYLCVDSDGVFLKPFSKKDFMYNEEIPYTILVEDNELIVEPEYYHTHWKLRRESLQKIKDKIGLIDNRLLTCHGFAILSKYVLSSLEKDFMLPNHLDYKDLLGISPYEFSWYNFWLQFSNCIEIKIREPLFKTFHHKNQHLEYLLRGITFDDISRGYLGVVVNSNYSRGFAIIEQSENREYILSKYLSISELIKIFFYKLKNYFKNKINRIYGVLSAGNK